MSSTAHDPHNHDVSELEQHSEPSSLWKGIAGAILLAVVCALLVFVVSSAADLLMLKEHETARITIELSDGVSAAAIGLLSYQLVRLHQQRRERLRKRVELIANMNHHVRNALQVISLSSMGKDKEEISAIHQSVDRIQWALRELLPKI